MVRERERDQNMTQSRRKEVIESNAGENGTPQKPQRLNLGNDSKVTKTEDTSEGDLPLSLQDDLTYSARWPHLCHLYLRECPVERSWCWMQVIRSLVWPVLRHVGLGGELVFSSFTTSSISQSPNGMIPQFWSYPWIDTQVPYLLVHLYLIPDIPDLQRVTWACRCVFSLPILPCSKAKCHLV